MLPINQSSFSAPSTRSKARRYAFLKRIFRIPQMDFEIALWQMLYLIISPRRVYRNISYHKQTKNQWARDDPAFVVLLSLFLSIAAVAYGIAYGDSFLQILKLMVYMVLVDFVLVGVVISTLAWLFANKLLLAHHSHSVEQKVEWGYAFDVHCNSFFPLFLVLYVLQFFFIPILTKASIISRILGNTMYFAAFAYYNYITFLGYSALPFLQHTIVFLYPNALLAIFFVISLFSFSISSSVLNLYFRALA